MFNVTLAMKKKNNRIIWGAILSKRHPFSPSTTCQCLGVFVVVTAWSLLLASKGQSPGMLITFYKVQATPVHTQQRSVWSRMSAVMRWTPVHLGHLLKSLKPWNQNHLKYFWLTVTDGAYRWLPMWSGLPHNEIVWVPRASGEKKNSHMQVRWKSHPLLC